MKAYVNIDALPAAQGVLSISASVKNTQPMMAGIGAVLVNRIRLGFRTGTDPWGRPWAPLKMRKGQPLRDTGRLQRSIGYAASADQVTVGTNVLYAKVHQFGAIIKPVRAAFLIFVNRITGKKVLAKQVTVPARPFLPILGGQISLPPAWTGAVVGVIERRLQAEIAKQGGSSA